MDTSALYTPNEFFKLPKQLAAATHWEEFDTGEQIKLSADLKMCYGYMLTMYNFYQSKGLYFYQSQQNIADLLGISYRTLSKKTIPELKRMGLLEVVQIGHNRYKTKVYPLYNTEGTFVNIRQSIEDIPELPKKPVKDVDMEASEVYHANVLKVKELQQQIDLISLDMSVSDKVTFTMLTPEEFTANIGEEIKQSEEGNEGSN